MRRSATLGEAARRLVARGDRGHKMVCPICYKRFSGDENEEGIFFLRKHFPELRRDDVNIWICLDCYRGHGEREIIERVKDVDQTTLSSVIRLKHNRWRSYQDFFLEFPGRFKPEKAGQISATFQFTLEDYELFGEDRMLDKDSGIWADGFKGWIIHIKNGRCKVTEEKVKNPDISLTMSVDDFEEMINEDSEYPDSFIKEKGTITTERHELYRYLLTIFFEHQEYTCRDCGKVWLDYDLEGYRICYSCAGRLLSEDGSYLDSSRLRDFWDWVGRGSKVYRIFKKTLLLVIALAGLYVLYKGF